MFSRKLVKPPHYFDPLTLLYNKAGSTPLLWCIKYSWFFICFLDWLFNKVSSFADLLLIWIFLTLQYLPVCLLHLSCWLFLWCYFCIWCLFHDWGTPFLFVLLNGMCLLWCETCRYFRYLCWAETFFMCVCACCTCTMRVVMAWPWLYLDVRSRIDT